VKGWKSGVEYSTPIRLLELNGNQYLVSLQGKTFWVRNMRKQGGGQLLFGGRTTNFTSVELPDEDKLLVLRAYMKRWWSVSKPLTTVSSPDAPDEEFIKAEPLHPVFILKHN